MTRPSSPPDGSARDRVGEQADRQSVEVGAIVIEDGAVVGGQEIGGRARPVRLDQRGHLAVARPDAPLGDEAEPAPLADRHPAAVALMDPRAARRAKAVAKRGAVEARRYADGDPPGRVRLPPG